MRHGAVTVAAISGRLTPAATPGICELIQMGTAAAQMARRALADRILRKEIVHTFRADER